MKKKMSEDNVKIENQKVNENASEKASEDSGKTSENTGKTKRKKTELDLLISQLKKNFNNKTTLDEDDYSKALKILEFNKTKNKINKMLNEIEKASKKIDVTAIYNSILSAIKREYDSMQKKLNESVEKNENSGNESNNQNNMNH
jgi:hypothetical protein